MRFRPVFMRLNRNDGFHLMGEKLVFEIARFMGQFHSFCVLIRGFGLEHSEVNEEQRTELAIRRTAKSRIYQMLRFAPNVFTDAMWQARIIGETVGNVNAMKSVGRPDIARGLINSAIKMMENKLREHFGKVTQKQKPKINQHKINLAVRKFYPIYIKTGQIPSQRQFAKELGVTPKGWRDYLKNNQLGNHDVIVKQWLDQMLSSVSDSAK